MEKKSSSNPSSRIYKQYEKSLDYTVEDVRPFGGVDIFRSAAYSNVSFQTCQSLLTIANTPFDPILL